MNLTQKIIANGANKCFFYRTYQGPEEMAPSLCAISEERYKIAENYKITLVNVGLGGHPIKEHLYIMDIEMLIKDGVYLFLVKQ